MKETMTLEDVLDVLIQLEDTGNAHYRLLAGMAGDGELERLFLLLAEQEKKHQSLYEGYRTELVPFTQEASIDSEYRAYVAALLKETLQFLSVSHPVPDLETGLAVAMQLEKDTLLFLSEMKALLGTSAHEGIDRVIEQERRHLAYLSRYRSGR